MLVRFFEAGFKRAEVERKRPDGEFRSAGSDSLKVQIAGLLFGEVGDYPGLKQEVAIGMLHKKIGRMMKESDLPCVGELNWNRAADVPAKWNDRLSVADMSNLIPPKNPTTCYIADFLYNQVPSHSELNVETKAVAALVLNWRNIQHNLITDIKETQVSQPLFAFELKSIMKMYADQAIESARRS